MDDFADKCAYEAGFVQRAAKFSGSSFAKTIVFAWLKNPDASLSELTQMAAVLGVRVSNQGLDQRFTEQAATFMKEILSAMVAEVVTADPVAIPLFQRFAGVMLQDSSVIVFPNELEDVWKGNGSRTGDGLAAMKIQVRLDLSTGALVGPLLENGRSQDKNSSIQDAPMPRGALRIADLGYFSLDVLDELEGKGDFYLSRIHIQTGVYSEEGERLELLEVVQRAGMRDVDMNIQLGREHRLKARLLARRVPPEVVEERRRRLKRAAQVKGQTISKRTLALAEWTILVTDVPREKLSLEEALVLMRSRWQIELLFKLWKQCGGIDNWRSEKPWRILCETYAKLIAMVVQHWVILVGIWNYPERSLVKAAQVARSFALMIASALTSEIALIKVIKQIGDCLSSGCKMNRRKKRPNTYQLLLSFEEAA